MSASTAFAHPVSMHRVTRSANFQARGESGERPSPGVVRTECAAGPQWMEAESGPSEQDPLTGLDAPVDALAESLVQRLRAELRRRRYAPRTEESYVQWLRRYRLFCEHQGRWEAGVGQPGVEEMRAFLEHLARDVKVAAGTLSHARNALLFLHCDVLGEDIGEVSDTAWARRPQRHPVVLSRREIEEIIGGLRGTHRLMAELIYATGLALMECVRLRVRDLDLEAGYVVVRSEVGAKERRVPLPDEVKEALRLHLEGVRRLHEQDKAEGYGRAPLPPQLPRPELSRGEPGPVELEWDWQYAFPSSRLSAGRWSKDVRRHHLSQNGLQKAVQAAAQKAGYARGVSCLTLRHSFAAHKLQAGHPVRTVQQWLGHSAPGTTGFYNRFVDKAVSASGTVSASDTIDASGVAGEPAEPAIRDDESSGAPMHGQR